MDSKGSLAYSLHPFLYLVLQTSFETIDADLYVVEAITEQIQLDV